MSWLRAYAAAREAIITAEEAKARETETDALAHRDEAEVTHVRMSQCCRSSRSLWR
jgi:hypothetical protein